MTCPHCSSENIDQTDKIDLTVIDPAECQHDFECSDCGCLFTIVYHAIAANIIELPEEEGD